MVKNKCVIIVTHLFTFSRQLCFLIGLFACFNAEVAISINQSDIAFLSYMQDKGKLAFSEITDAFPDKSLITLKRSAANLNYYLSSDKIHIQADSFHCNISYTQFIDFLQRLNIKDYRSSVDERIKLIIVFCFLYSTVNVSALYEEIRISLTTKKKDLKVLEKYLAEKELQLEVVSSKGIRIVGNEIALRMVVMSILASVCELDSRDHLIGRAANDVYEQLIFTRFRKKMLEHFTAVTSEYHMIVDANKLALSYPGRKLLYTYMLIARVRTANPLPQCDFQIELLSELLYQYASEQSFMNYFVASLDQNITVLNFMDIRLRNTLMNFYVRVQSEIITVIIEREALLHELYLYIQKCIIRWKCGYSIFDNNLSNTRKHYNNLYTIIQSACGDLENIYSINFSESHIATMTLIFRKYINKSKISGRNKKTVIIVTNSAFEKVDFFIDNLKFHLDVDICDSINIHEREKLSDLNYHLVITFSNRISMLLQQMNINHVKVNYHLNEEDINNLLRNGFSSNLNRKIRADKFVEQIQGKTNEEIMDMLKLQYSKYFI